MSYFDDASLVMIPSGYKTDKVYSVKPTDGSGDLTFTRSNDTATRVNSAGLIEKVRTNLILQSNGFDTASWTKSAAGTGLAPVITANAGTAPDGTNNAFRVQFDCVGTTSSDRSRITQNITSTLSTQYTYSFYIKAFSAGDVGKQVRFIVESSTSQAVVTLTADWQRIISTGTTSSTSPVFLLETRGNVTVSTTADVLLAFTQAELGDIATDYIETTTAAVSVGPVANVPRLDYLGSTCGKLILEPQRTNLVTFSEQIDNAAWNKTSAGTGSVPVVTANDAISPDGYMNADKVVFNGGAGTTTGDQSFVFNLINLTAGQVVAFTGYFKGAVGGEKITLRGTEITLTTSWQRYTSIFTAPITGTYSHNFGVLRDTNGQALTSNATIYAWGCQAELGAYATSYIPTLGAAVTRGADAASKTGISSLIGQTEGTFYVEVDAKVFEQMAASETQRLMMVSDGTNTNRVLMNFFIDGSNRRIEFAVVSGGIIQASMGYTVTAGNKVYKIAGAYKTNDFALYVDGVEKATDLSGSTFSGTTLSRLDVGQDRTATLQQSNPISQALLFKTRLSNADLAALTA